MLGFGRWPDNWGCNFLPIPDFNLLTTSSGDPLKEFLACMRQKAWIQERGVELNNINGDLNYFGYWRGNDHKCIPDEQKIDKSVLFSLFTDFTLPVRKELRLGTDRHASRSPDGDYRIVERLTQSSYYQEMREAPVYISLTDIKNGQLRGVIEKPGINFWMGVDNDERSIPNSMAYTWWTGLIELCQGAVQLISDNLKGQTARPIQVIVSFRDLAPIKDTDTNSPQDRGFETQNVDASYWIKLQSNFLANFVQKDNSGERLLFLEIFRCVMAELEAQAISTGLTHEYIVASLFSDEGVRLIHAFRSYDEIHRLIFDVESEPRLIDRKIFPFMKIKMANQLSLSEIKTETKKGTKSILNQLVEAYWKEVRAILKTINKRSLIEVCLNQLQRIQVDKVQWTHTAKAVQAIYSKYDNVFRVAQNRDSERNLTSLCLRTIIEMAVSEGCDIDGGKATLPMIEHLVILVGLMIEIGSDSDAVHSEFSEPKISIEPSGFFENGTEAHREVVIPYLSGFFHRQFSEAIESYEELYQEHEISEEEIPEDNDEFSQALQAEVNLSEREIFSIGKAIIREHLEKKRPILVWEKDELLRYLERAGAGDTEAIESFLYAFSLPQRKGWDDFSVGHEFKDIAPWKFKRRLSCLCRPIIPVSGNQFLSSAFLLRQGLGYFLDLARDGLFTPSFFSSKAMRSYVGKKTSERGLWFNEVVAQKLIDNGFETTKELEMSTFGKPELGDVDVVGIKGNTVTLIECKNLQMAKTVSEIADICNRFRGEEKDELAKHLKRVEWIDANRNVVSKHLGLSEEIEEIKHLLVTNTEIPIKYKEGLPISSREVLSITDLQEALIESSL